MLKIAFSQIVQKRYRFISAGLAILLGVGFLCATLMVNASNRATMTATIGATYIGADYVAVSNDYKKQFSDKAVEAVRNTGAFSQVSAKAAVPVFASGPQGSAEGNLTNLTESGPAPAMTEGSLPSAVNQVAIDEQSAGIYGLRVGGVIDLSPPSMPGKAVEPAAAMPKQYTVSGIMPLSADPNSAGKIQLLATTGMITDFLGQNPITYPNILLNVATPSANDEAAQKGLDALRSAGYTASTIRTPQAQTAVQMAEMTSGSDILGNILMGFAAIAILVSCIVIANTFSVLLTQRTRELALLRCIGAKTKQLRNSVLLEALFLGLIAGTLGIALSIGAMTWIYSWIRSMPGNQYLTLDIPMSGIVLSLAVGLGMTLLASYMPARIATRVSPLAALGTVEVTDNSKAGEKTRAIIGAIMFLGGSALLVTGAMSISMGLAIGGGVLAFLGLVLLSRTLVPPMASAIGKPLKMIGLPGTLARLNTIRNPGRTASTASALLIGTTLVTMLVTGAQTAQISLDQRIQATYPVDLSAQLRPGTTSQQAANLADKVKAVSGVQEAVIAEAVTSATSAGSTQTVYSVSPAAGRLVLNGSEIDLSRRVLYVASGSSFGPTATIGGELIDVVKTKSKTLPPSIGTEVFSSFKNAGKATPEGSAPILWAKFSTNLTVADLTSAINKVKIELKLPENSIQGSAVNKLSLSGTIGLLLTSVFALLAVAVLISLVGIINTLSLSMIERSRESALLRALGLTKSQLRQTVIWESLLITTTAAIMGVVIGIGFGLLGVQAAIGASATLVPVLPLGMLALILLASLAAGFLAAIVPAWRASKRSPVSGLAEV